MHAWFTVWTSCLHLHESVCKLDIPCIKCICMVSNVVHLYVYMIRFAVESWEERM